MFGVGLPPPLRAVNRAVTPARLLYHPFMARTMRSGGGARWVVQVVLASLLIGLLPDQALSSYSLVFGKPRIRSEEPAGLSVAAAPVWGADGRADVLLSTSNLLLVYPQRADGTLGAARSFVLTTDIGSDRSGIDTGDLDGDGRRDVAVAITQGIAILYQRGKALSEPVRVTLDPPDEDIDYYNVYDLRVADLNRDGRKDMALNTYLGIVLLWNTGKGFRVEELYPAWQRQIEVGDVSGDGIPEIIGYGCEERCPSALVHVFSRQKNGTYELTDHEALMPHGECGGVAALDIGDVTGDGRGDIVAPTFGCSQVLNVYRQKRDGSLAEPIWYPLEAQLGEAVEVKDMNGDGRKDVIVGHGDDAYRPVSHFGIFLQRSVGTLRPEAIFDLPPQSHYEPTGMDVASINGDSRPDVVLAAWNYGLVYRLHR